MIMNPLLVSLAFAGGFGLCWVIKDKIIVLVAGTESFIKAAEAKAAVLKAAL
jgi:hypothetical protein